MFIWLQLLVSTPTDERPCFASGSRKVNESRLNCENEELTQDSLENSLAPASTRTCSVLVDSIDRGQVNILTDPTPRPLCGHVQPTPARLVIDHRGYLPPSESETSECGKKSPSNSDPARQRWDNVGWADNTCKRDASVRVAILLSYCTRVLLVVSASRVTQTAHMTRVTRMGPKCNAPL